MRKNAFAGRAPCWGAYSAPSELISRFLVGTWGRENERKKGKEKKRKEE